jgi:Ca-activated chloride channel family protein
MDDDGKLALSRRSLGAFVHALAAEDRFEVLAFNVEPQPAFGALRAAGDDAKREAEAFLGAQRARGGTFLEPALRAAYAHHQPDRPLNVVILSDGMTEQRERGELLRLAAERPPQTRLFTIGIGNDVDRPLLEQLAEDAGGLAAFVSRGDDFTRQARAFRRKLQRPVASNLQMAFAGGGVYDLEPQRLPSLFHGVPVRLYGRYREAGPVTVRISADVGGERLEREVTMDLPAAEENPEIERMWAWKRVDRLLDEGQRAGDRKANVDEIVRLGEAFSIVTEHTSFLVLENDAEYRRWKIERRNALRVRREERKLARLREELTALRRRESDALGPAAVKTAETPAASPSRSGRPALPGNAANPAPPRRGGDLDRGGGALDPLSAALAAAVAALGIAGRRRRRR